MDQKYVLITPARNEAAYIEQTIISVVNQTLRPVKHIIVSDGSTDDTDVIAKQYASRYDFIDFLRREGDKKANFKSKVFAFNSGVELLQGIPYTFIGNLDADISFGPNYFENILKKFNEFPKLGIAGGQIWENRQGTLCMMNNSLNSVAGAVMFFDRRCFEEIGGYVAMEMGGEDTSAEIKARAKGWVVQTFLDIKVTHNKPMLSQSKNHFESKFKQGMSNYILGYHPLFQIFICLYRMGEKPFVFGSLSIFAGFCWAKFKRLKHSVPQEVVSFLRKEQLCRLTALRAIKNSMSH